jgi:hypothetical protein
MGLLRLTKLLETCCLKTIKTCSLILLEVRRVKLRLVPAEGSKREFIPQLLLRFSLMLKILRVSWLQSCLCCDLAYLFLALSLSLSYIYMKYIYIYMVYLGTYIYVSFIYIYIYIYGIFRHMQSTYKYYVIRSI